MSENVLFAVYGRNYFSHLSSRLNCASRSLITSGLRSLAYSIAFSQGNPLGKNEMRQSHSGQHSTGSFRIMASSKIRMVMHSNFSSRLMISRIGLEWDFLLMAQIPATTLVALSSMASQWDRPTTGLSVSCS